MSEEIKHTPGPFHVVLDGTGGQDATCSSYNIVNEAGSEIAKVETRNYDDTEWDNWDADRPSKKAEADAQFVKQALNTHDTMLATLKACSYWLKFYGPVSATPDSAKLVSQTIDAAIAKAEGRAE